MVIRVLSQIVKPELGSTRELPRDRRGLYIHEDGIERICVLRLPQDYLIREVSSQVKAFLCKFTSESTGAGELFQTSKRSGSGFGDGRRAVSPGFPFRSQFARSVHPTASAGAFFPSFLVPSDSGSPGRGHRCLVQLRKNPEGPHS